MKRTRREPSPVQTDYDADNASQVDSGLLSGLSQANHEMTVGSICMDHCPTPIAQLSSIIPRAIRLHGYIVVVILESFKLFIGKDHDHALRDCDFDSCSSPDLVRPDFRIKAIRQNPRELNFGVHPREPNWSVCSLVGFDQMANGIRFPIKMPNSSSMPNLLPSASLTKLYDRTSDEITPDEVERRVIAWAVLLDKLALAGLFYLT
jgi:hypothetical protein